MKRNLVVENLDLSGAPSVIFLFGLAGAGKNFVGDFIARHTGRHVYHADCDLTATMCQALAEKRHFTASMLDEYFLIVADKIIELRNTHSHLVVTQAVYRAQHRHYLSSRVSDMDFIWVNADEATIMRRLLKRGDAISPEYASQMRAFFEVPLPHSKEIQNISDAAHIAVQLSQIYGRKEIITSHVELQLHT